MTTSQILVENYSGQPLQALVEITLFTLWAKGSGKDISPSLRIRLEGNRTRFCDRKFVSIGHTTKSNPRTLLIREQERSRLIELSVIETRKRRHELTLANILAYSIPSSSAIYLSRPAAHALWASVVQSCEFMHVSGQMMNSAGSTLSGAWSSSWVAPHANPASPSAGESRSATGLHARWRQPKWYGTLATMSTMVFSQVRRAVAYSGVIR